MRLNPQPGKALVTGGAGFIGSALVRCLVAAGHRTLVVDNLVNGRAENLAGLPTDGVMLHRVDIRHHAELERLLADVSIVYHLACLGVRHSVHSPLENHEVNASATLHLLHLAQAAGVQRFVHVSSSEVYGTAQWAPMTELHPTFPMTVYGAGKLAGEAYARAFHETYQFPTVVVRPFNAFGPRCHHEGDSGEVIPKFLLRCLAGKPLMIFGDGKQTRDFSYVDDTARGIFLAGIVPEAVGHTINLGTGGEVTINNLAQTVSQVCGRLHSVQHIEPRPGDVFRLVGDATLARRLLGYQPQVSLAEGLARLLAWYQECGHTPEELLAQEVVRNWEGQKEPAHGG